MDLLFGRFVFGVLLPIAVIVVAIVAIGALRRRSGGEQRIAALEEQVRGLLYRVWLLERSVTVAAPPPPPVESAGPAPAPPPAPAALVVAPVAVASEPAASTASVGPADPVAVPPTIAAPGARRHLDLEQRIGARWTTWVGAVAILFGIGFFLKWSFENELLGPRARVVLGLVAGLALLAAGLFLRLRRDVRLLSEGLTGLGLGVLYVSLYGAHAVYGLAGPGLAFAAMFAVTLLGAAVSALTDRQSTAVLAVLGGLLTPVLLSVDEPDERNLLAYLVVLNLLVLGVARFRNWPALGRIAWVGTALLFSSTLSGDLESPHPLTRLALLSALFVLFLALPLVRPLAPGGRQSEIDLFLVVANAAAYFWAVYTTLELWHPGAEAPYALALAVVYRLVSSDYADRVPGDEPTVVVHEGVAWTFLTLAVSLALHGRWVTLAWAVQGVALLWSASRVRTPVAAWGGLLALLLAAARVVAVDVHGAGDVPIWNGTYLAHLLVVAALIWGGALAAVARPDRLRGLTGARLEGVLWVVAVLLLAVLLWREPSGFWPATLLTAELLAVACLARLSRSPAWVVATPLLALVMLARVLIADDLAARIASESLLNAALLSRVAACAALGVAGRWLARSVASAQAPLIGRWLGGAAGVVLLFVLSTNWMQYQGAEGAWTTQVGLSVLWTLYAAAALAWGFLRGRAPVRYAALALFGVTVFKVFLVDLAAVRTAYRILSFLVLGTALLGVSLLYQKGRRAAG